MKNERRTEAVSRVLQRHIKTFSRVEKAFYASIIMTIIILAISIVFLQSHNFQLQQKINQINNQISEKQTELENAKQEVNELGNRDRVTEIAKKEGLTNQKDNVEKVK